MGCGCKNKDNQTQQTQQTQQQVQQAQQQIQTIKEDVKTSIKKTIEKYYNKTNK